ncbi:MAG: hypothetical protein PHX83_12970 [Acidobacteriia bacterium]|nr:hypothetical protein [Terriglobia bacterium]
MSGKSIKERARNLAIDPNSRYALLQKLILDGSFDSPISSEEVVSRLRDRFGKRWKTNHVQTYMQKFLRADIVQGIKLSGHRGNYWVISSVKREEALRSIGKKKKVREIEEELFSEKLMGRLKKNFGRELEELQGNFGKNGNCTAFLLRKILEKLIIIVITKNGKGHLLEAKNRPGGWIGLKDMIETAAREKLHGVPFLVPKTANEIKGIKFLGDTAAHNPLVDVEMSTILPQMPYVITAYEELAKRL